ncbi:MAG: biofilm PGA synthesis protein PgaB [Bacteroidales bacterium]|nr:biofilm PGA synthesis protein PgaB [Bacteroidales bacterium]
MTKRIFFLFTAVICAFSCTTKNAPAPTLNVGMLDGLGSGHTNMTEAFAAAQLDSRISIRYITSANIAFGVLDSLDVLIIPGGGGSMHTFSLGQTNINLIKKYAENGGGILCICAGAYALSHTPDYACFGMNGAQVYDLDHSSRGQGLCSIALTEDGKKLFPELKEIDTLHILFENGPMLVPADSAVLAESPATEYTPIALMLSDVHTGEEFQPGISPGKPFFLANNYGKGRVFTSIGHPEGSASFSWMIPRILWWCAGKEDQAYPVEYKAPYNDREIIMSNSDLQKEGSLYRTFVYGTKEEKLEGMEWMMAHPSWSMKTWAAGLLYDKDPEVRTAAARYISESELLTAKKDIEAAFALEEDENAKAEMQKAVEHIESLYR